MASVGVASAGGRSSVSVADTPRRRSGPGSPRCRPAGRARAPRPGWASSEPLAPTGPARPQE
eukprot:3567538-Alexandrium_andersonii.AAC.1